MTDDGRYLSRRERRAQEERDAAIPAETDALELGPISESIPTHTPDGRMLTRRERRRLERARQPMETWTAEEEMIATGQIPAMTPERIAEQEKLARERAAAAQEEAAVVSAELEGVLGSVGAVESDFPPRAPGETSTPSAPEPAPQHNQLAPPPEPERTSLIAAVAADVAPVTPDTPQSPESPQDYASASVPSAPAPVEPEPEPEPQPEPAPAAPAPTPIPGMPPGMSPEMFAELFPPGSLQRRMIEDQAVAEAAPEPEVEDPAAEIRRLTQEAVAGIDAASASPARAPESHASPEQTEPAPSFEFESAPVEEEPAPWGASAPVPQASPGDYSQPSMPSAPPAEVTDSSPPTFGIPTFGAHAEQELQQPEPLQQQQPWQQEQPWQQQPQQQPEQQQGQWQNQPQHQQQGEHWQEPVMPGAATPVAGSSTPSPAEPEPHLGQTPFDAILGDHPGTAALDQASGASAGFPPHDFGDVSAAPAPHNQPEPHQAPSAQPPVEQPSPWGVHPLAQVDREAPELPQMPPAQSVPQPDLSGVGMRGPQGTSGPVPIVEPVPTGQIEVPPRVRPDLASTDVPRHFKWAHLAVFGAVALLLGVVVWHVI